MSITLIVYLCIFFNSKPWSTVSKAFLRRYIFLSWYCSCISSTNYKIISAVISSCSNIISNSTYNSESMLAHFCTKNMIMSCFTLLSWYFYLTKGSERWEYEFVVMVTADCHWNAMWVYCKEPAGRLSFQHFTTRWKQKTSQKCHSVEWSYYLHVVTYWLVPKIIISSRLKRRSNTSYSRSTVIIVVVVWFHMNNEQCCPERGVFSTTFNFLFFAFAV